MLGCSIALMRKMRLFGSGPAYSKVGRLVRYAEADLAAFIAKNRVGGRVGCSRTKCLPQPFRSGSWSR
jgi:hypothetical protein